MTLLFSAEGSFSAFQGQGCTLYSAYDSEMSISMSGSNSITIQNVKLVEHEGEFLFDIYQSILLVKVHYLYGLTRGYISTFCVYPWIYFVFLKANISSI